MARRMYKIKEIGSDTRGWTARVIVESKTPVRQAQSGPKKFQRLVLVDEDGDRVGAVIFDLDIGLFQNSFNPMETYLISNARVGSSNPAFDNFGSSFQWTINGRTVVNKDSANPIPASAIKPVISQVASVNLDGGKNPIDVLAVVIKDFGERTVRSGKRSYIIHEFGIVSNEGKPLILSLWNNIATSDGRIISSAIRMKPIVLATNVTPSSYYGLSLSTTPATAIVLNPATPEAEQLRKWQLENTTVIEQSIKDVNRMVLSERRGNMAGVDPHTIAFVKQCYGDGRFIIQGSLQVSLEAQSFYYIGCEQCNASLSADANWPIDCQFCKRTTFARARPVVVAVMKDATDEIVVTLYGDDAGQILKIDADTVMNNCIAGNTPDVVGINATIGDKFYTARVKKSIRYRSNTPYEHYAVVSLVEKTDDPVPDDEFDLTDPVSTPSTNDLQATVSVTVKHNTDGAGGSTDVVTPSKKRLRSGLDKAKSVARDAVDPNA